MVEDYNPAPQPSATTIDKTRRASSAVLDGDADMSQPKKKHWYNVRKSRRHSDGGTVARGEDEEPVAMPAAPGKSFVVIRDKKPQAPQSTSAGPQQTTHAEASGTEDTIGDVTPKKRRGSFMVLRDDKNGRGLS
jgi:hypothetical protein